MHDGLARLLAKGRLKILAVVLGEHVARHGLAAILVYPLQDLVAGGVAQAGEEGEELAAKGGGGLVLEDDLVELAGVGDLWGSGPCSVARSFLLSARARPADGRCTPYP